MLMSFIWPWLGGGVSSVMGDHINWGNNTLHSFPLAETANCYDRWLWQKHHEHWWNSSRSSHEIEWMPVSRIGPNTALLTTLCLFHSKDPKLWGWCKERAVQNLKKRLLPVGTGQTLLASPLVKPHSHRLSSWRPPPRTFSQWECRGDECAEALNTCKSL